MPGRIVAGQGEFPQEYFVYSKGMGRGTAAIRPARQRFELWIRFLHHSAEAPMLGNLRNRWRAQPYRWQWVVFAAACAAAFLLFAQADVVETSNHSYVLLDSVFSGRFLHFYEDVAAHPYGTYLYYINNAHYNIVLYLIFAAAELPLWAYYHVFDVAHYEPALYFTGKLVSAAFFFACIPLVRKIAAALGGAGRAPHTAVLLFALWPPAFFSAVVMGQYDSVSLFFILAGFLYWCRKDTLRFALMMGLGACCKFFALLLFIPLLLLAEKHPLHAAKYAAASLWLLAPLSLLFLGRTGDAAVFNLEMLNRLFDARLAGIQEIPLFPALYFALCIFAYFWAPGEARRGRAGLWLSLSALALLFIFVHAHPQWFILLAPFMAISTALQARRAPWYLLDLFFCAGFVLYCFFVFPNQLESNLFDYGVLNTLFGLTVGSESHNPLAFYLGNIPQAYALAPVLLAAPLLAHGVLKFPCAEKTPAERIFLGGGVDGQARLSDKAGIMLVFAAGALGWFLPSALKWLWAVL